MFYYMLAVTLAVTAFIAHQLLRRLAVLRSGGTATGTVVGHEIEDGYEATVDHPVVRFTDHLRQDHTFRAEGPRSQSTRLGARVPVVYLHVVERAAVEHRGGRLLGGDAERRVVNGA
jgi:hypothetical protein